MKTLQPYIDIGWYTVPLKGKLSRKEDGSKTIPQFPKDWKRIHSETRNTNPSQLGGVLTGRLSNLIAIDCDNEHTFNLFQHHTDTITLLSRDKPKGGGTLLYSYPENEEIPPAFRIHTGEIEIDFYTESGFIYLPTDDNTTKHPLTATPRQPPELPALALTLLRLLHHTTTQQQPQQQQQPIATINHLRPQVDLFLAKGFIPSLFKIITPKEFRSSQNYIIQGYLHPNQVEDGDGSRYLSQVSTILGADPSIDTKTYFEAMRAINLLWDTPLDPQRLEATIINRMLDDEVTIDGAKVWKYDDGWDTHGFTLTNKLGEALECFFDDIRQTYYVMNHTSYTVTAFTKENDLFSYIETVGMLQTTRKSMKSILPIIRSESQPTTPFGFYSKDEYTKGFNTFKQTPALDILNNPSTYKPSYHYPQTTLMYLETLMPERAIRDYVLSFIHTKLTGFKYSPIILYLLGITGSGKDMFVEILTRIMGEEAIARPTSREFLEHYNGWLVDKYFVQLDEYGDQLSRQCDKDEALGKIKAISGKSSIQIRRMRSDGKPHKHNITLIMTANNNPLMVQENDRRLVLIDTPNKLDEQTWVLERGGIARVHSDIMEEVNDLCYYIATEVPKLGDSAYVLPPSSLKKHELVASRLSAGPLIVYLLKNSMFDELRELCEDNGTANVLANALEGHIIEEDLADLYAILTKGNGTLRGLAKYMREAGFQKFPTTRDGRKAYLYKVPILRFYNPRDIY